MAKILVTGSLGFIGSHLFRRLVNDGHNVESVDIKENRDIRNLEPGDMYGIDYVFHLAAQAKVPLSIEDPIKTHDHNVNGTLNVLWCAKEAKVKRVIYSASSSAYGEQEESPLIETMVPKPMSPYGTQKLIGEFYCKNFSDLYGLETVCLRYFNVYGEGMPTNSAYSAAIAIFMREKKQGHKLPIFGGNQKRDFTYVGDVVEANIAAINSTLIGGGEIINIGSGKNYTIKEIARAVSDKLDYFKQRKGEPMETLADITRASQLLGWSPKVDVIQWLTSQKN